MSMAESLCIGHETAIRRAKRWPALARAWQSGQTVQAMAIFTLTLVILLGLVIDIGNLAVQQARARAAIDAAALAGAQALDEEAFIATNDVRLTASSINGLVSTVANRNQDLSGVQPSCQATGERTVACTGSVTVATVFGRFIGIEAFTIQIESNAELVYGIVVEGQ